MGNMIGQFTETSVGNWFEYAANDTGFWEQEWPHLVYVGPKRDEYRYARVLATRLYMAVDEDEYGNTIAEKWLIKRHLKYGNTA
jgi:hypothetical protein